ncbi:hypothetical protein OE88DRAFT_1667336 [Heliocybe sulcata]|uniref:Uncharacterized protein n=1 Tax=Heliocybe sulcata TaxID=5364 RepID=A0A5C3MPG7_9AGAM|nr:hypothetical protein OE88DRAFT_1667336 [Heliocybe sulcata]
MTVARAIHTSLLVVVSPLFWSRISRAHSSDPKDRVAHEWSSRFMGTTCVGLTDAHLFDTRQALLPYLDLFDVTSLYHAKSVT